MNHLGLELPQVGFGTADLGADAAIAVKTAITSGYRLIDTARAYNSEKAVGNAILNLCKDERIQRQDIIIQTKLAPTVSGYYPTLDDFQRSLELLQTDYIDVYFIHWPVIRGNEENYREKNIETWLAFEKLYREQKIRMPGVCNFLERHLLDLLENCSVPPLVHQLELHPGYQQRGLVRFSREHGMRIQAWSPMGRGILNKPLFLEMAQKYHKDLGQLALRWSIQHGYLPLTRSGSEKHIKSNLDIFQFSISDEDMQILDALNTNNGFMDIWSYKRQQMY